MDVEVDEGREGDLEAGGEHDEQKGKEEKAGKQQTSTYFTTHTHALYSSCCLSLIHVFLLYTLATVSLIR